MRATIGHIVYKNTLLSITLHFHTADNLKMSSHEQYMRVSLRRLGQAQGVDDIVVIAQPAIFFIVYIILVYKIPYRRARALPSGFRPSASREQRYFAYKAILFSR